MSNGFFLELDSSKLYYTRTGSGSVPLLLFHGFGQDHTIFEKWTESLGHSFTLYAFDTFFHGKSEWARGEEPLSKAEWKKMMHAFFLKNEINQFSMLGFSMGGKFALAILEAFPEKVIDIILVAPDGIKTSFWYSLATYPVALRRLFKSMIGHPERFAKIASTARGLGLIDKGILRFVEYQMNTPEKRQRVYFSWVVFRHFSFDLSKIATLINGHDIHLQIFTGRYDKIITSKNMNRLLKKVKSGKAVILEAGHNNLLPLVVTDLETSFRI